MLLAETSPGCNQCPLSAVGRCPLSEVQMYSNYMGKSIGGMRFVRCIQVVRFSEVSGHRREWCNTVVIL